METTILKLLLLESDLHATKNYTGALSKSGLKVLNTNNLKEALRLFVQHQPEILVAEMSICQENDYHFIRHVLKKNTTLKIILLVDSGSSNQVVKTMSLGVKSFLPRPVSARKLVALVQEQAAAARMEKVKDATNIKNESIEKEDDISNLILQSVSEATTDFFKAGFNQKTSENALRLIGETTSASRVYIYQSSKNKKKSSKLHEWVQEDSKTLINIPDINDIIVNAEFDTWKEMMQRQGYFSGIVSDFTQSTKSSMNIQYILSILLFPITVNNEWWGFVGIDTYRNERLWRDSELNAMKSFAFNLGAAIYRKQLDDEMVKLNQVLEQRVKERTSELEIEVFERSIAEALLKDSEEKYRLIYEHASYGILLMQGGRITMVNPAMIEIFEDIPRNLIGRELSELVPKKFKPLVVEKLNKETEETSRESFEIQVLTSKNKSKWLELKPKLISWYSEPAYLVFASNISLRKKAEQELQQLNSSLENRINNEIRRVEHQRQLLVQKSKLESMGELSAGLAHEINQPLVSISMGLDNILMMISDQKINEEYVSKKISTLFKDIDRIRNIIEHVRIFSRDQQVASEARISVNDVIRNALSMIRIQFTDHHVQLKIDIDGEEVFTYGNQYKLEQVILNLLSNAKYAVEEKAKRNIGNQYEKEISIYCGKENNMGILTITDNGTGIEKNILSNIFNPFFTTKDEEKGTGLGLSISYAIINEMKGSIKVNSEVNQFTKITIELPLNKQEEYELENT